MRVNPKLRSNRFDGTVFSAQVPGLTTANGLAWSPDGRRVHWSDTKAHRIYAADYDVASGVLSAPRVFAEFSTRTPGEAYGGRPDGAAMDAEGCYWAAMFEGGCLLRIAPTGEIIQRIELPAACPTMPTFGGAVPAHPLCDDRARKAPRRRTGRPTTGGRGAAVACGSAWAARDADTGLNPVRTGGLVYPGVTRHI